MPARPTRPLALQHQRGNPSQHKLPEQVEASEQLTKLPEPPKHLSLEMRQMWKKWGARLIARGLLTGDHLEALADLCVVHVKLKEVRAFIDKNGWAYNVRHKDGRVMRRAWPEVRIESDLSRRYLMRLSEFGMTPAAERRVAVMSPPTGDPMAEFFSVPMPPKAKTK